MASETSPTFDSLLLELNDFGPYQIKTILLLCLPATFLCSWQFFDLVFLLYTPDKHCQEWNADLGLIQDTFGNVSDECEYEGRAFQGPRGEVSLHCQNWTFDQRYFENTVATQWGFCHHQTLYKNIMAIFMVVGTVGLAVMSVLQDVIGRKPTFFICLTLSLTGCGFSLLAPSIEVWVILRLVQIILGSSNYNLPFVWAQEFVGAEKRTVVTFMINFMYSIGTVTLGLVAWACHSWRQLGLATVLPFILFYAYYFLVDESPRWLLSVGKLDQATKIIEKMARWNKKEEDLPKIKKHLEIIAESTKKLQAHNQSETSVNACFHALDLCRYPNLRMKTILLTIVWVANSLVYCSLAFNAPNLTNMFVAYIAQAAVEAPACIVILLLSNRIGRIPPIIISMLISAFFCFLCIPAYTQAWNDWYVVIFAALAKFGICISINLLFQAAGELYPTSLRGTGIGMNSIMGDLVVGAIPYLLDTASAAKWIPMLIMGTMTFIGAVCCSLLPEPMEQAMTQVALEAETVSKASLGHVIVHLKNLLGTR